MNKNIFKNPRYEDFDHDAFFDFINNDPAINWEEYFKEGYHNEPLNVVPTNKSLTLDNLQKAIENIDESYNFTHNIKERTLFGKMIKTIRAHKKDYLFKMAEKLNMNYRTCQDIETGKVPIPKGYEYRIKKIYNLNRHEKKALYRLAKLQRQKDKFMKEKNNNLSKLEKDDTTLKYQPLAKLRHKITMYPEKMD